jgi:hypothetical protein
MDGQLYFWVILASAISVWYVISLVYPVLRLHDGAARRLAVTSPEACASLALALLFAALAVCAARPTTVGAAARWIVLYFSMWLVFGVYVPSLITRFVSPGRPGPWPRGSEPLPEPTALRFRQANYTAEVAVDGCLTHLIVGRRNFLRLTRRGPVRGAFLCQGEQLDLPKVERAADDSAVASSEAGSVRYDFGAAEMTATATNHTSQPMEFVMAFSDDVHAMMAEDGSLARRPADGVCTTSTWFANHRNVRITGSTRVQRHWHGWGPALIADLAPGETREVHIEVNAASEVDVVRATGWWLVFRRKQGSGPRRNAGIQQAGGQ